MKNPRARNTNTLAAIDIGTNSFHMVIVAYAAGSAAFKVIDRVKESVRLGTGSADMKYLSAEAMDRGIETLRRFKRIADAYQAPVRAIATSAVREALNRNDFIRRVRNELEIRIEVASGVEEARLIYLGILRALPVQHAPIMMMDIGGGSTEFLVGKNREIRYDNSLKLGAIRLTQRFFPDQIVTEKKVKECRKYVSGMLLPVVRAVRKQRFTVAVGSSGTVMAVAKMVRMHRGEPEETSLNGFTFTAKELNTVVEAIVDASTVKERLKIPGLDPSRADIIVGGAIILEQTFRALKLKTMTVSEFALREGIILDTIERKRGAHRFQTVDNIRYASVLQLAETFKYEEGHSRHVAALAVRLFDLTKNMHGFGPLEREYLEAAALLHEIGIFVSHANHHRHSHYLIRNSELLGYTDNEKEIIANIARYHRKSHPKLKHENYALLSPEDQELVVALSALLRIADGLDRTHAGLVRDVALRRKGRSVTIALKSAKRKEAEMDLWGAERKKELFEEAFRCSVQFTAA